VTVSDKHVRIIGASVRAAAFSALRAGLVPLCADLFADADLRSRCQVVRLTGRYPGAFRALFENEPPDRWMYTGGLENHPELIEALEGRGPLLGNGAEVLRRARDPMFLNRSAHRADLPAPEVRRSDEPDAGDGTKRWLVKPLAGAGGIGIHFREPGEGPASRPCYLQEYIEGTPTSALYVGDGRRCRFLGLTRQLVGEVWLNAAPFRYCGSIGPLDTSGQLRRRLQRLGEELVRGAGLRGLFGVDGVLRAGLFLPVELNPRYTASVEVVEHATGLKALDLHWRTCLGEEPGEGEPHASRLVGKATLFAEAGVRFPAEGPWTTTLRDRSSEFPLLADIPAAGEEIATGHPVLTLFAAGSSAEECERLLRQQAAELAGRLWGEGVNRNIEGSAS
jgi:predicted ATP-grasp superfamily ATP-dependent carboligase